MKIKLFTHTDLDGVGCAIILKRAFPDTDFELCNYHEINDKVRKFIAEAGDAKYDKIYITDISVDESTAELIESLPALAAKVHLLDHHMTAAWLNKYDWAIVDKFHQDTKTLSAGTSMVYQHLIDTDYHSVEDWDLAQFVEKVRRYDTWDWNKMEDTHAKELNDLLYIIGQNKFINRFISDVSPLFNETEQLLLEIEQKRIDAYVETKRKQLKKIEKDGFKFGVVFADTNQSIVGNILAEENPELNAIVMLNPGGTGMSLRSIGDRMHVGDYLKFFYGGGGHANAAGAPLAEDLVMSWVNEVFDIKPPRKDE